MIMLGSLIQEVKSSLLNVVGQMVEALPGVMIAIVILCLTRYAAQTVRGLIERFSQRLIKSPSLKALALQISYATTWVLGIVAACVTAFPGLGLGDIIALLGLGSVAIGFAFQDIVKNFLAGILLLLQQPFRLGDQILVQDYEGTVRSISLRCTEIMTYQGERVLVPNSIVFTSPVHVMTADAHRRTDLEIGVDYNTPLPVAVEVLLEAVRSVSEVKDHPTPEVDIVGFGDSSINLVVRYWTIPPQAAVRRIKTDVMIALKKACDRADINIPYPIRTLYFYNQESFSDSRKHETAEYSSKGSMDNAKDDSDHRRSNGRRHAAPSSASRNGSLVS